MNDILFKLLLAQIIWSLGFIAIWYLNRMYFERDAKSIYYLILAYYFSLILFCLVIFLDLQLFTGSSSEVFVLEMLLIEAEANPIPNFDSYWLILSISFSLSLIFVVQYNFFKKLKNDKIDIELTKFAKRIAKKVAVPNKVSVLRNNFFSSIFSFRFFSSYIILPKNLTLSDREMSLVLAHELIHVKHHDFYINCVQKLIRILSFYNPIVYHLDKKLDYFRELRTDEEVIVKMASNSKEYSKLLIHLKNEQKEEHYNSLLTTAFLRKKELKKRIIHLNQKGNKMNYSKKLISGIILFMLLLTTACLSIDEQGKTEKTIAVLESSQDTNAMLYHELDTKPTILEKAAAKYPKELKEAGIEGMVVIDFIVNKDGRAENFTVLKGHSDLAEAALVALKQYKFTAGKKDGKIVNTKWRIPVRFKLNK